MSSAPSILLLDAGGVFVAGDTLVVCERFVASQTGIPASEARELYLTHREALWTGQLSEREWWALWEARYGRALIARCPLLARQTVRPLPHARKALALPARRRVLSNHLSDWLLPALRSYRLLERLEDVAVSDAIGACKPDAEAFQIAFARANASPEQVLFVDDQQRNIDAAAALGAHTLLADADGKWVARARVLLAGAA